MGLPVRHIADYLDEDSYCWTSDKALQSFLECWPNHFDDWSESIPADIKNSRCVEFFQNFGTFQAKRIFVLNEKDDRTALLVQKSLKKLVEIWDSLLPEVGEDDWCSPNSAWKCLHILEGLMWFIVDQYLEHIDEGGPVCVHSSRWGTWCSLGGMIEDEPYLVYGGEWEYLYDGKWNDPRENDEDLPYMLAAQRALVGDKHVGFELLEPVFVG